VKQVYEDHFERIYGFFRPHVKRFLERFLDENSDPAWPRFILDVQFFMFLSINWNGGPFGIPYVVVPGTQPKVNIGSITYADESDPSPYPIPADVPIEGGSQSTGTDTLSSWIVTIGSFMSSTVPTRMETGAGVRVQRQNLGYPSFVPAIKPLTPSSA
jgi:hypothetical protein